MTGIPLVQRGRTGLGFKRCVAASISPVAASTDGVVGVTGRTGVETPLKDGEVLSASGSRWVGTGIRVFYYLAIIAIGAMVFASAKKLTK